VMASGKPLRPSTTAMRMLDRQPILEPSYPKPRVVEVDLVTAEADRLADAQISALRHPRQPDSFAQRSRSLILDKGRVLPRSSPVVQAES
jgi:hypothetical protein